MTVVIESYTQGNDGRWLADGISSDCETKPEVDSPEWEDWWESHCQMPYVFLMPVHHKIIEWLNENFRFEDDDDG